MPGVVSAGLVTGVVTPPVPVGVPVPSRHGGSKVAHGKLEL